MLLHLWEHSLWLMKQKTEEKPEEKKVEVAAPCSSWITVNSCKTYYLCADNYENGQEVLDAVEYFDEQKGC